MTDYMMICKMNKYYNSLLKKGYSLLEAENRIKIEFGEELTNDFFEIDTDSDYCNSEANR